MLSISEMIPSDINLPNTAVTSTQKNDAAWIVPEPKGIASSRLTQRNVMMPVPSLDTFIPSYVQRAGTSVLKTNDENLTGYSELRVESNSKYPPLHTLSSITDIAQIRNQTTAGIDATMHTPEQVGVIPSQVSDPMNFQYSSRISEKQIKLGNKVLGMIMKHPEINQLQELFTFHWNTQSALVIIVTPQSKIDDPTLALSAYFQKKEIYGTCAAVCQKKIGSKNFLDSKTFTEHYELMLVQSAQTGGFINKALQVIHLQSNRPSVSLTYSALKRLALLVKMSVPRHFYLLPVTFYEPLLEGQVLTFLGLLEIEKSQVAHDDSNESQGFNQIQKIACLDSELLRKEIIINQSDLQKIYK